MVRHARPLRGRFKLGPDAGLFSFAALLGAVSRGTTVLYHDAQWTDADRRALLSLLQAIGTMPDLSDDRWEIHGLGALGLLEPAGPLDLTQAGKLAPLAIGLLGPYDFATRLTGSFAGEPARLSPVMAFLRSLGVDCGEHRTGRLPLTLHGPRTPMPFEARLVEPDPVLKGAMLLAALALPGTSSLVEAVAAPDSFEHLLRHFGASLVTSTGANGERVIALGGLPALGARTLELAGDVDLLAFPLLAALIVPGSEVIIENVPFNAQGRRVVELFRDMGGRIEEVEHRLSAGEDVADLRVFHSALLGVEPDPAGLAPSLVAPLAIAGAFAAGETLLPPLHGRADVTQRRQLASFLEAAGARVTLDQRGLHILRPSAGGLHGARLNAPADAALLAAALVLGTAVDEEVVIDDTAPLTAGFPHLIAGLQALGAAIAPREVK